MACVPVSVVARRRTAHRQTPTPVGPPTNGGTGSGDSGTGNANGTDTANGTAPRCSTTGNQTGDNGDHDAGGCTASSVDHDAMGDRMSSEHRSASADAHIQSGVGEDLIVLAQLGLTWTESAAHGLASLGGLVAAFAPSGAA